MTTRTTFYLINAVVGCIGYLANLSVLFLTNYRVLPLVGLLAAIATITLSLHELTNQQVKK